MLQMKPSNSSVTYRTPRDSGQEFANDEDTKKLDQVLQEGQGIRLDVLTASNNGATVKPFCTGAFAKNLTMKALKIMEGTLKLGRSSTRVANLNTRLIESIPGGDTALMSSIMAEGANPDATCRLDHVSACHMAAMHDNDALDLLLSAGADSSRSDQHGRTPLHLTAWTGNVKQIAVLLNFPEALRKIVVDQVLSPETVKAVSRHSQPVNKLTNVPCRRNVESTLPDEWSDGVEHSCRNIKAILPVFEEGWTPLHVAGARAQHHCVQLLLAAGADASAQDLCCRTPLDVVGCAHYMGHRIDANNFMQTVDLLLKAGGQFLQYGDNDKCFDTPLHTAVSGVPLGQNGGKPSKPGFSACMRGPPLTAVELESEAAVKQLLQGGASATEWNSRGLTAMHMCVEKRNKELLQLLANHKCSNEDPSLVTVDMKDQTGSNVLCAAVKADWIQGVCIALDAGASITVKENGKSPMHIASKLGNILILQKILNVAQERNINYSNEERATALFMAISHNHQDALELLLENGFSIETVNLNKANVFHIATKHGRKEILEYLLGYDSNVTEEMINMCDRVGSPLYYAVERNHPDCAALLISKGAQVNVDCEYNRKSTTLLHIAARKNHCEIAEMIIDNDSKTVHVTSYGLGWTPLHEACHYGNREMIVLLLRKGADLSGVSNAHTDTPIELLMKYLSKPTELIEEVFDSCISSQDECHENCSIVDVQCGIKVDYTVLGPPCENVDRSQMRVIQALLDTGNTYDQQKLLLHPLVESFVFLRWRSLSPIFYSSLALHVCFVLSVNMFAFNLFKDKDRKIEPVPNIFRSSVWIYFIYFSTFFITIQDIIFLKKNGIRNLRCETWLRFLSTPLAIILPLIVSWDSESQAEWVRLFSATTLFFTWVKIMFLLSRFPKFGYYVLMYEKVARRVINILVPLGCLIVGFCISFMIQFHAQPPFEGFWSSLLMTMVMMSSEPGYKDTFNKDHESASLIMLRLTFAAFLFLVSIVLMNMIVGVAVNDVKDLELIGHTKRLKKQVEFITAFEGTALRNLVKKILSASLYKKWFEDKKLPNVIEMRSRCYDKCTRSNWYHLHARLREAIFEKAQLQKKQSDEKQDHKKLDEIHKVIVKNDNSEVTTTERLATLETAVNKIFEEICKSRRENVDKVSLR